MSELNIKIRKLQDNGSTFRATPESLYMGGVGSAKVDTLCFDVPEEWKGCAITLHVQRLSGTLPDPQLLDEKNRAVVDQRWTKEKQGLWMLMAVGADGYTAMTKPGRYTCYETIDRDSTTETITPSVYEQFVALVKKETAEANRAAKNAAASAEIAKSIESTITATGEQVQREITATADQTKQAVDEKAKAALASIPEDYTTLSESVGQLKEDIDERLYYTTDSKQLKWSEGYIDTSGTIVDINNIETGHPSNRWRHIAFDCKEHDEFIVKAIGGTKGRLWAFIGAENQVLKASEAEKKSMDAPVYLYAPHNSAKIIINDWSRNQNNSGTPDYPENAAKVYCYQVPDDRNFYGVFNSLKSAIDIDEIKICNIDTADKNFEYWHYVYWGDGVSEIHPDFCSTGYIDISGYKRIGISNGLQQFAYYDKDKTYISGVPVESSFRGYKTYSVPGNAKYVRFSVLHSLLYAAFYVLINAKERESKEIIVSKYGNGNFTRLRDGVEYATKYQNSTVKVLDGVYDLLEEFSDEINEDLSYQYGIELKNNVHVIFSSGAKITALYNGKSQNVENYFSPFFPSINNGDFVLENVWIETKNTRYCVHDDLGGGGGTQIHKYINCHMEHDSLNSLTDNYPQCIGGGLGKYTYIDIEGGYYKRAAPKKSYTRPTISYHNNFTDDANGVSHICVRNIYVDTEDGTVTIQNYGNNTKKSILEISGCSLGIAPFSRNETEDSKIVNTEVVSFNNEIRQ